MAQLKMLKYKKISTKHGEVLAAPVKDAHRGTQSCLTFWQKSKTIVVVMINQK